MKPSSSPISSSSTALVATALTVAATSVAYWVYQKKKKSAPLTVAALYVYPVKSAAPAIIRGGKLTATSLGFVNDRAYQVVVKSGGKIENDDKYEFCTPRNKMYEKLFKIHPLINYDGSITLTAPSVTTKMIDIPPSNSTRDSSGKIVKTAVMCGPDVQAVDCGDAVACWLEDVLFGTKISSSSGPACRLVSLSTHLYQRNVVVNADQDELLPSQQDPAVVSFADEAAYHLATQSSLDDLNRRLKKRGKSAVRIDRFRPNIVLSGGGDPDCLPWVEDTWKRIRIGRKAEFYVWQRTGRCTMTTIDRDTLVRGPEPLATLSEFRERAHGQRNFGMHLIAVAETLCDKEGGDSDVTISVGDHVEVLEYDDKRKAEWKHLFG